MVGERLAELRKDKRISQQEFADILGLSASTISSYEREINEPDDDTKIRIAQYFNISLDYLLGVTDEEIALNRKNVVLLPKDFPDDEVKSVEEYIDFIIYRNIKKKRHDLTGKR